MTDSQYNNIFTFNINNDSVITYAKTVGPNFRICQFFRVFKRIVLQFQEGFAYLVFYGRIKFLDVFFRPAGIDKFVTYSPKSSLCDFVLPALYSARASLTLLR